MIGKGAPVVTVGSLRAPAPGAWPAVQVNDANYADRVIDDAEKQPVWKCAEDDASHIVVCDREGRWTLDRDVNRLDERSGETAAESDALLLVPIICLAQVAAGTEGKADFPFGRQSEFPFEEFSSKRIPFLSRLRVRFVVSDPLFQVRPLFVRER